jgi:crotonobetainyl-CoA:carnitine CoA-transferase CaiB-like acyl-CoA transferase
LSDGRAPRALEGVRVLSLGAFVAGHTTTLLLAELGADVVQIEAHDHPEILRFPAYGYGGSPAEPSGIPTTPLHGGLSRSTRGLSIDMATPEGRDMFRRLVTVADVVVENFSPTLLDRWECSHRHLVEVNPRLVMVSLSGYGRSGPRAGYRAYASNIANFVGLSSVWGAGHPTHTDYVAAEHAVVGVLAALHMVERTGQGVWLDVAQIDAALATMATLYLDLLASGQSALPLRNEVAGSMLTGVFAAAGRDRWLALELEDLADWNAMTEVLDRPDLVADDEKAAAGRRDELRVAIAAWVAQLSPHAAAHLLQRAGLAAGAVQDSEDIVRDPQLRARDFPVEIDHPDLGVIEYAQSPHRMSVTPGRIERRAPRLGEHTGEVLADWLGMAPREVDEVVASGVAWQLVVD